MRTLFLSLLLLATARGGEHRHFPLPVGPGGRESTLHAYVFNSSQETLRVVDQGDLARQAFPNLGIAARELGAFAGVNGGFFDSQGNPLGRFIADGKGIGEWSSVENVAGGLVWSDGRQTGGSISAAYDSKVHPAPQLLQAGPVLVDAGVVSSGLDAARFSRRTVVLTDGGKLWALAFVPGATLDGLAKALSKPGAFPPFQPKFVLNLGGGGASGLWIKRPEGHSFYLREISKVRNFLVVVPINQG